MAYDGLEVIIVTHFYAYFRYVCTKDKYFFQIEGNTVGRLK
jgi:hypothetical protein